ncbi:unnamed protein product [Paramecium sonneborni]|uniref:Uncharacterized protein n=1 Tax=Paramecium sonneborni TaxID=65129 RepID=A0A8S1KLL8_9CILI|nr:unnamed protein product [Paramecium sonneborni]
MIKHNIKWKSPKQDVIQTFATPKSTFYITRRIIQTKSDRSIKLLNNKATEQIKNQNQQTCSLSRVLTTTNYRSLSTTPTNGRRQFSQNIDLQSHVINTERYQSSSILSSELHINSIPKTNRVVSLYQDSIQNQLPQYNFQYESQGLNPFAYSSKPSFNTVNIEQAQLHYIDKELIENIPIPTKKDQNARKSIFQNTNYQIYSKIKIKNKQLVHQKQQIFLQKVLKNIKDSQNIQAEPKQFTRKYSKIWKENFQQPQFQEQQQYQKSSQQFKLYFNQLIEKILNKFLLYQQITELIEWMNEQNRQTYQQFGSLSHLRQLYIQNHKLKCVQTEIENEQFRYKQDIKSFGMIDILSEFQEEEIYNHIWQQKYEDKYKVEQIVYFQNEIIKYSSSYKINHIISILDNQTKNILLSDEYTNLDKLIYKNNIEEHIPEIQSEDKLVKKAVSKLLYKQYSDILIGSYLNLSNLNDIEHNNYHEQQQQQISLNLDKKAMLLKLRRQTKEAKIQGRRSALFQKQEHQPFQNIFSLLKQQENNIVLQVLDCQRRKSKSTHNFLSTQMQEHCQDQDNNQSLQEESITKDLCVKPVKYKQQMRLQNLMIFDQIIKKENSQIQLVQLMIEHNLFDELIDFLRQHPNFSLNSRNIEGKPFIMLAAQSGNVELVQYMINQNVHVNVKDLDGNTALHYAITFGYYQIADLLLQNGANPYSKNRNNQNPWNWNHLQQQKNC